MPIIARSRANRTLTRRSGRSRSTDGRVPTRSRKRSTIASFTFSAANCVCRNQFGLSPTVSTASVPSASRCSSQGSCSNAAWNDSGVSAVTSPSVRITRLAVRECRHARYPWSSGPSNPTPAGCSRPGSMPSVRSSVASRSATLRGHAAKNWKTCAVTDSLNASFPPVQHDELMPTDALEGPSDDPIAVRVEAVERLRADEAFDLVKVARGAEVLPAIDHVQHRRRAARSGLANADRAGEGPGFQAQRRDGQLQSRVVQRQRLLADAGSATAPELMREARAGTWLATEHLETQRSLARLAFEGSPRIALGAERPEDRDVRVERFGVEWRDLRPQGAG